MQSTNLLYSKLTQYYDVIYAKKNFSAEARWIYNYLRHHGLSKKATLLDVACGTGRHITYWQKFYQCVGVDVSKYAISLPKKRVPRALFLVADMQTLQLGTRFDVVTCLFGSIAYARTVPKLRKTLRSLSAHIKINGFLIIEPWISPKNFVSGFISSNNSQIEHGVMHRLSLSHKRVNGADIDEHYLIAHNGKVRYYRDTHHLGLFGITTIWDELRRLGFYITLSKRSNLFPHGIIIARKN